MWKIVAATTILLLVVCRSQQLSRFCAITGANGTVVGCFDGVNAASIRRFSATGFAQVSAGLNSFKISALPSLCALTNSGKAVCFGACAYGECSAPSSTINQISVGDAHACAVMETGLLSCWGCGGANVHAGQCNFTSGQFKQVSAGPVHTCALRVNGSLSCFGCRGALRWSFPVTVQPLINDAGQCSPPSSSDSYVQVSSGAWHTCSVTTKGALVCFGCGGDHDFGQCASPPAGIFTAVASGYVHTCALSASGVVQCFGCRASGILSFDGGRQCNVPSLQVPQVQISVSSGASCSIGADSVITCWGCQGSCSVTGALISPFSDLAMGHSMSVGAALSEDGFLVPMTVGVVNDPAVFNTRFASVAASRTGICLLSAAGRLVCPCSGRVCRPPAGVFKQLSGGELHMCALAVNGSVFCWGCDALDTARPCDAPSGVFKQVSAGVYQSCAIRADTRVTCWGCPTGPYNYSQCAVPAGVIGIIQLTTGSYASCALFADGHARCWTNSFGFATFATPPPFPAYSFASLSTGYVSTCGVLTQGTAKCWKAGDTAPGGQFNLVRTNRGAPGMGGILANGTMLFWGCSSSCLPIPLVARQLGPPSMFRLGRQLLPCPAGVLASPFRGYVTEACGGPCPGGTYGVNCANTCPPGSFCPSGSAAPVPCPIGRFSSVSAASSLGACSLCQIGSYCSAPGAVAPTFCPAVSYMSLFSCAFLFLLVS